MKTIEEIRLERLKLLKEEYKTVAALAAQIGKSESQVSQWLNASRNSTSGRPRTVSSDICREIESACGKPRGWMDNDPSMISLHDLMNLVVALAAASIGHQRATVDPVVSRASSSTGTGRQNAKPQ